MKQLLTLFFVVVAVTTVTLTTFAQKPFNCLVKGEFKGLADGKLMIRYSANGTAKSDSIQ